MAIPRPHYHAYTPQELDRMADPNTPCLDDGGRLLVCVHKKVKTRGGPVQPDLTAFPQRIKYIFNFETFRKHVKFMMPHDMIPKLCPVVLATYYEQFLKLFLPTEPILARFAEVLLGYNIPVVLPEGLTVANFMETFMQEHAIYWKEDQLDANLAWQTD